MPAMGRRNHVRKQADCSGSWSSHDGLAAFVDAHPDYLLSGHSHIARDWRAGPTRRINPGALFEAEELSVASLDLESDDLRFITIPD